MTDIFLLGIDAGGTHTDCVLVRQTGATIEIIAEAKVSTNHNNLTESMREVLHALQKNLSDPSLLTKVSQVSLGTTLAVNALVQGKTDKVGLLLTAGPGLSPKRFIIDEHYHIVKGGVDHRGVEVTKLDTKDVQPALDKWKKAGIKAVACVGKFSPRSTNHEDTLAQICQANNFNTTRGSRLSGELNYPRRIATAYYNAAVQRIQNNFLDAVEETLKSFGINATIRLLKADGGAIPTDLARKEPVESILSGPAASVLGIMALTPAINQGVSLLLDIGGTTSDLALIIDGSPVLDREGMLINGRRTLVRALASKSIGVGGDSKINVQAENGTINITVGPQRVGPAQAFGGSDPTLLDALNVLKLGASGDPQKSSEGIEQLAKQYNLDSHTLALEVLNNALLKITTAANSLVLAINSRPIYTLAQLRTQTKVSPERLVVVGGPAPLIKAELKKAFNLEVLMPKEFAVANAVGACLTRPTESLEVYADSAKAKFEAPKLGVKEKLMQPITQKLVEERALQLLQDYMAKEGCTNCDCEIIESHLFATLNDYGASSRDIRVTCQAIPGIIARPNSASSAL